MQFTLHAALQRWLSDLIEVRELRVEANDATLTVNLSYALLRTGEPASASFVRPI